MTPNRRCETCTASAYRDNEFECHFNPPTASVVLTPGQDAQGRMVPQLVTITTFPPVKLDDFCLRWAPMLKLQS